MAQFDQTVGLGVDGPVSLSKRARDLHMQVVGLSGQGKSHFLEHLVRQDILNGAGVCLIDPHGDVYNHLCDWMAVNSVHRYRDIHLVNLAEGKWSVGFNPLAREDVPVGTRVGAFLDACQVVWGDEESSGHRTLARLLRLVLTTLAASGLTIREAPLVANVAYTPYRKELVEKLGIQTLIDGWAEEDARDKRERASDFKAVQNRLRALVETPVIQSMLGENERLLDFKKCMRGGDIVMVNLAHKGKIEPQAAQLLGALFTADMFYSCFGRDEYEAAQQPFYAYIDECSEYLNPTIVKALDQTRKYGLHYVLSHQRMAQLGKPDDPIRKGVLGGAQNKAVFLQEDDEDTKELGVRLFGKLFDFERVKESLMRKSVVGYEIDTLRAGSVSDGRSSGDVAGSSSGIGAFTSAADADGAVPIVGASETSGDVSVHNEGRSRVETESWHEVLVPILEDVPNGTYSKEEQLHMAATELRKLEPRQAFIYRADDRQAVKFTTHDTHPATPTAPQISDFYGTLFERVPTYRLTEDIEAAVAARRKSIVGGDDVIEDDDQFRVSL